MKLKQVELNGELCFSTHNQEEMSELLHTYCDGESSLSVVFPENMSETQRLHIVDEVLEAITLPVKEDGLFEVYIIVWPAYVDISVCHKYIEGCEVDNREAAIGFIQGYLTALCKKASR